jgi:hypothetical protein
VRIFEPDFRAAEAVPAIILPAIAGATKATR